MAAASLHSVGREPWGPGWAGLASRVGVGLTAGLLSPVQSGFPARVADAAPRPGVGALPSQSGPGRPEVCPVQEEPPLLLGTWCSRKSEAGGPAREKQGRMPSYQAQARLAAQLE